MRIVLTGGTEPTEYLLAEDATGWTFDDCTIFDADGREAAQWSYFGPRGIEDGRKGWFPEGIATAPEECFPRAELRS